MESNYFKFLCPDCGNPLEVYSEEIIDGGFDNNGESYAEINLIRHCEKCHSDWENSHFKYPKTSIESQLERKFWG